MLHTHAVSPVFVGRQEELSALQDLLAQAAHGRGGMAVIAGEAGVGKTRLCRELKSLAAARSFRVIEGRSSAAEASVPYGPFMDALRFRIARGERDSAAEVLQPILPHVAPLFTALAGAGTASGRAPRASGAPFESIFGVLHRLASLGPILFVLEDIHWADATSRALLQYIAHRVRTLPMLVVATYRTDELVNAQPVQRFIAGIVRERAAVHIQLEPLAPWETAALVEALLNSPPSPELLAAVYDRTEGNPLFVEEHISALKQEHAGRAGDVCAHDFLQIATPLTLHDIVWERISLVSEDAREALSAAAVCGRRFRFDVMAAALHWPEDKLLAILEELIEHRIIVEIPEDPKDSFSFRHSVVQEVIYSAIVGRRRRQWHRRVAAALEQLGDEGLPHTVLAHHYGRAGELQAARIHTMLAGDEAARLCAWQEAESMYEAALVLLERAGGNTATEAELLERMAEVAWWQNRVAALAKYSSEALVIRRAQGDRSHAAALLRRLANLDAYQRGDTGQALTRLQEARALLENDESSERVYVLNDLGRLLLKCGAWTDAGELFEQSLAISAGRGDCAEEAFSLVMLGWIAIHSAQVAVGCQRLELARALLAEESLPVERTAEIYHAGIRALEAAREHQAARQWVDDAIAYAAQHGAHGDLAIYRAYQAAVQRRSGEWDSAIAAAMQAVAELRANGRAELREALRILGDLQRGRGDLETATQCYQEAFALGEDIAAIGQALVFMAEGNHAEAVTLMAAALESHVAADTLFALRVLPLLVEARCHAGALDEARPDLDRLRELMAGAEYRAGAAALAQASGIVHSAQGEGALAIPDYQSALAQWQQLDLPFEAARASLLLAQQLMADAVDQQQALVLAESAVQTFEQLGAALDASRAHDVLRRGGVRKRRNVRRPPLPEPLNALTPRESEVLLELARGKTNKQIAQTLSMSPRTVGNHVAAIFAKLGCARRTEASRLVLELRVPNNWPGLLASAQIDQRHRRHDQHAARKRPRHERLPEHERREDRREEGLNGRNDGGSHGAKRGKAAQEQDERRDG